MRFIALGVSGPYPAPGGTCSGYLFQSDDSKSNVLIDCGAGVFSELLKHISLEELDAVILTHLHYDHMSDMLPMQYALIFSPRERALPVIAPDTPNNVRELLNCEHFDVYAPERISIGGFKFDFIPAKHTVEAYSISIECDGSRMIFTGDTNENVELSLFADGCDMLLADSAFSEAQWGEQKPHLSALRCGRLARDARAKALLLTHLNPENDVAELLAEAQTAYPDAQIAHRGGVYYV